MTAQLPRRQLVNHQPVQGALIRHTLLVWGAALTSWSAAWACWRWMRSDPLPVATMLEAAMVAAAVSLVFLPCAVLAVLRLTNRFTGPVHRVKQRLQQLTRDPTARPLATRKGDFWPELIDACNQLILRRQ